MGFLTPEIRQKSGIPDFGQKSTQNDLKSCQEGFQRLRIGRGFVLVEYEPVGSRLGPIRVQFGCQMGPYLVLKFRKKTKNIICYGLRLSRGDIGHVFENSICLFMQV